MGLNMNFKDICNGLTAIGGAPVLSRYLVIRICSKSLTYQA